MSDVPSNSVDSKALIDLYNDLADELNDDKGRLRLLKSGREAGEVAQDDPDSNLNYLQGKVIGFEIALTGIRAFIEAQTADAAGLLSPDSAKDTPESS